MDAERPITLSDDFGGALTNSPWTPSTIKRPSGVNSIKENNGFVYGHMPSDQK